MSSRKNRQLKKRYIELAGMLKEKESGDIESIEKIKCKFALQEGLRRERVQEYLDMLEGANIIVYTVGQKGWVYNEKEEWKLFGVKITGGEIING